MINFDVRRLLWNNLEELSLLVQAQKAVKEKKRQAEADNLYKLTQSLDIGSPMWTLLKGENVIEYPILPIHKEKVMNFYKNGGFIVKYTEREGYVYDNISIWIPAEKNEI